MCDGSGATSWNHDQMGRTPAETRITNGQTKTTSYAYNLDSSLSTLTYPGTGKVITYTPGGAGRPTAAQDIGSTINYVESASYAPFGGLTGIVNGKTSSFNGITTTNAYNDRLQPILLSAASPTGTVFSQCFDFHLGVPITAPSPCSFSASPLGDNGNVNQIVNNRDSTRTESFTYDSLNRIASGQSSGTQWGETFTIDAWGNLTNETGITGKTHSESLNVSAGTNNQLSGFGYDAAGNMTSNGTASYTYDAENRLTLTAGYTYTYDGDGNRVKRANGSTGTLYWRGPGGDPIVESSLTGTNLEEYMFFNGRRVARRDVSANAVHYYFSDHLGSHGVVENATGSTCEQDIDYYPYGGVEHDYCATVAQNYKFTGKERDSESGLDHFGARHNASALGRFMSVDPKASSGHLADPQSWNRYAYAGNDPLAFVDPDGKEKIKFTVYTFIPYDKTSVLGITYNGGPKTVSRFTIETNAAKAKNPVVQPAVEKVHETVKYNSDGTTQKKTGEPSANAEGFRGDNGDANVHFTQADKNPLSPAPQAFTPPISVDMTLTIPQDASRISGDIVTSDFPAMQVTATYENGDTQLLFSQTPARNSALLLFLSDEHYVEVEREQNICPTTAVVCESGGQEVVNFSHYGVFP
jgi:RHS repeat-associated protein